jgi:hypothetical protein
MHHDGRSQTQRAAQVDIASLGDAARGALQRPRSAAVRPASVRYGENLLDLPTVGTRLLLTQGAHDRKDDHVRLWKA